jgi:hypothetical protein
VVAAAVERSVVKRKGKVLAGIALFLLVVIGVALYPLLANLDSIVARVIEVKGSEATGTAVTVDRVSIELRAGRGTIAGLEIANPPAFSDRPAMVFDEIRIEIDPMAATSSPIVIREVSVSGARVLMEQTTAGNNLRALQDALQRPADDADADGPGIVIERFLLEDAGVAVEAPQLAESREAGIQRIELTDVGRATNGATAGSVARQLLAPIIRAVLESAAARALGGQLEDQTDAVRKQVTDELLKRLPSPGKDSSEQGSPDEEQEE